MEVTSGTACNRPLSKRSDVGGPQSRCSTVPVRLWRLARMRPRKSTSRHRWSRIVSASQTSAVTAVRGTAKGAPVEPDVLPIVMGMWSWGTADAKSPGRGRRPPGGSGAGCGRGRRATGRRPERCRRGRGEPGSRWTWRRAFGRAGRTGRTARRRRRRGTATGCHRAWRRGWRARRAPDGDRRPGDGRQVAADGGRPAHSSQRNSLELAAGVPGQRFVLPRVPECEPVAERALDELGQRRRLGVGDGAVDDHRDVDGVELALDELELPDRRDVVELVDADHGPVAGAVRQLHEVPLATEQAAQRGKATTTGARLGPDLGVVAEVVTDEWCRHVVQVGGDDPARLALGAGSVVLVEDLQEQGFGARGTRGPPGTPWRRCRLPRTSRCPTPARPALLSPSTGPRQGGSRRWCAPR